MKQLHRLIAFLCLAMCASLVTACDRREDPPMPVETVVVEDEDATPPNDVDECPRRDGEPCR